MTTMKRNNRFNHWSTCLGYNYKVVSWHWH